MRAEAGPELIARAKCERAAFGELYDLYIDRVYAFCLGHTAGREEAEDMTALTFERALTALPRYEDRGAPLSSWLFRIAANAVSDRARRAGRLVPLGAGREGGEDDRAENGPRSAEAGPEEWVERWERARALRERVAALPADQQQAVWLRFYEDRALGDVAARMERSEGAVKQLLQRALKGLRAQTHKEALADV